MFQPHLHRWTASSVCVCSSGDRTCIGTVRKQLSARPSSSSSPPDILRLCFYSPFRVFVEPGEWIQRENPCRRSLYKGVYRILQAQTASKRTYHDRPDDILPGKRGRFKPDKGRFFFGGQLEAIKEGEPCGCRGQPKKRAGPIRPGPLSSGLPVISFCLIPHAPVSLWSYRLPLRRQAHDLGHR